MSDVRPGSEVDPLITSAEACRLLGDIDRSTLTRWVQLGRIVAVQKLDGKRGAYLFTRAAIDRRLEDIAAQRDAS